jgi:hypothetical protein
LGAPTLLSPRLWGCGTVGPECTQVNCDPMSQQEGILAGDLQNLRSTINETRPARPVHSHIKTLPRSDRRLGNWRSNPWSREGSLVLQCYDIGSLQIDLESVQSQSKCQRFLVENDKLTVKLTGKCKTTLQKNKARGPPQLDS